MLRAHPPVRGSIRKRSDPSPADSRRRLSALRNSPRTSSPSHTRKGRYVQCCCPSFPPARKLYPSHHAQRTTPTTVGSVRAEIMADQRTYFRKGVARWLRLGNYRSEEQTSEI